MTEIKITTVAAADLRNAAGQTISEAVTFRKMATIRRIDEIGPIEGAETVESENK